MRRREFLAAGVGLWPLLSTRWWPSAPEPLARAAVVIGVNKCGTLPVLRAADTGANAVGDWLQSEQFEVFRFVTPPVQLEPIKQAVFSLIHRGTLDQLVIYFSGHGFLKENSEMWMLSDAPRDPNAAVSLLESIDLARHYSGIKNVVFISDACRSATQSLQAQYVRGSLIFPTDSNTSTVRPEIDRFMAAGPGDSAFEVPVDASSKTFEGLYTSSFLDAFKHPRTEMVKAIGGIDVVPNRKLKDYLVDDVSKRASAKSIAVGQLPDAIIESGDETYIGRVLKSDTPPPPPPPPQATVTDVAERRLSRAGLSSMATPNRVLTDQQLNQVSEKSGFDEKRETILRAQAPPSFDTGTGFSVKGAMVVKAIAGAGVSARILPDRNRDDGTSLVGVNPQGRPASSLLLRFPDGSGTVVAALRGFIGALVVEDGRVTSLNYTRNGAGADEQRLAELRATVATAVRLGAFRIDGNADTRARNSRQLADRIRVDKGIDPTLGLYAAYAYAEAGVNDEVRSVQGFMRSDLDVDIFDVAMLSGDLAKGTDLRRIFPFCPMLSQGWGWLRVRGVDLPPALERARDYIRPSLWTTFDPKGTSIVEDFMRSTV